LCLGPATSSDIAAEVEEPDTATGDTDNDSGDDVDSEQQFQHGGPGSSYAAAAARNDRIKWTSDTFLKPCQLLSQLSGYPNLSILYSVFCCLAVSSASAERALSKLKIVKNRLRSTLCDDTLSALMVLASEKDLLAELSNNSIISRLSVASKSLKAHLHYT